MVSVFALLVRHSTTQTTNERSRNVIFQQNNDPSTTVSLALSERGAATLLAAKRAVENLSWSMPSAIVSVVTAVLSALAAQLL